MNALCIDVPAEGGANAGRWRFYPIGDLHLDLASSDENRIRKYVQMVADDPYGMYVLVGDVIDGTTPDHKFFDPSTIRRSALERMNEYVMAMTDHALDVLAPLRGRPGIVIEGNHDIRHGVTWAGFSPNLARQLGAAYGGGEALVRVRALKGGGKTRSDAYNWTVYCAHGAGGGMYPGGKVNRHQNTASHIADADIYVRGHVHDSDVRILPKYSISMSGNSRGNPRIKERPIAYVTAGSFTNGRRAGVVDYAGRRSYPPNDEGIMYLEVQNPNPSSSATSAHDGRIWRHEAQL